MKKQKILLSDGTTSWTIVGKDDLPLPHVEKWVEFLTLNKEDNTVENYVSHLNLFLTFCEEVEANWQRDISLQLIIAFIWWLKNPGYLNTTSFDGKTEPLKRVRGNRTINYINTAVKSFYDYHTRIHTFETTPLNVISVSHRGRRKTRYRKFLSQIDKNAPEITNAIRLPEDDSPAIQLLTKDEVKKILKHCTTIRDKFIFSFFYETGVRSGELLGLRHEDISPWDNKITIRKRRNNPNKSNQKTKPPRTLDVTPELIGLYTSYLIEEVKDIENDFVFVVLNGPTRGRALTKNALNSIVRTIKRRTGIRRLTPHLFRHTNITDLIKSGASFKAVQRRSGHEDEMTLLKTYTHCDDDELRDAIKKYHDYIRDCRNRGSQHLN